MEIMRGTFTGIGVGPGDPELLTLKAVRLIRECHVAAVPVSDPGLAGPVCEEAESLSSDSSCAAYLEKCAAYQIALRAVPELASKPKLFLPMPMIKDKAVLKEIHDRDASAAAELLDGGRDIVFLTLGDPTVYSTCMYGLRGQGIPRRSCRGSRRSARRRRGSTCLWRRTGRRSISCPLPTGSRKACISRGRRSL